MRLGSAVYECCMQQSVLLGNTGREGVLLAALSAAGQDRLRQCMNAAPAKNAAGQDRQGLNAAGSTQCCWARQAEAEHDH